MALSSCSDRIASKQSSRFMLQSFKIYVSVHLFDRHIKIRQQSHELFSSRLRIPVCTSWRAFMSSIFSCHLGWRTRTVRSGPSLGRWYQKFLSRYFLESTRLAVFCILLDLRWSQERWPIGEK
jgi:hypothetical protein